MSNHCYATGGYDNGSPAGKGNLQLDLTLNPGSAISYGQTYVTWNYGVTDKFSVHGYASHEATGTNQIYNGLKYTFFQNNTWDLSTAAGFRRRKAETHYFFPQFLYTYKLPNDYDIGGSIVNVYDKKNATTLGISYDIALRIPFNFPFLKKHVKNTKLALGAFRSVHGKINPTYSIDFKFGKK